MYNCFVVNQLRNQKGNKFMSKTINQSIINKSRPILTKYGSMVGTQLLTVKCVNIDNKYYDIKNSMDMSGTLLPIRPVQRYKIVRIDITGVELAIDADGTPSIIINRGRVDEQGKPMEILCPLADPQFNTEPNTDNIAKALENQKNGAAPLYFRNIEMLTEAVNRLNKRELDRVNALIESLKGQANSLTTTIRRDSDYVREYRQQLGEIDGDVKTSVHIIKTDND